MVGRTEVRHRFPRMQELLQKVSHSVSIILFSPRQTSTLSSQSEYVFLHLPLATYGKQAKLDSDLLSSTRNNLHLELLCSVGTFLYFELTDEFPTLDITPGVDTRSCLELKQI